MLAGSIRTCTSPSTSRARHAVRRRGRAAGRLREGAGAAAERRLVLARAPRGSGDVARAAHRGPRAARGNHEGARDVDASSPARPCRGSRRPPGGAGSARRRHRHELRAHRRRSSRRRSGSARRSAQPARRGRPAPSLSVDRGPLRDLRGRPAPPGARANRVARSRPGWSSGRSFSCGGCRGSRRATATSNIGDRLARPRARRGLRAARDTFGSRPGLQAGVGLQVPVLPNATGPVVGIHAGVRWSDAALAGRAIEDPSDRSLYLLVTIAWQQAFKAHVVDLGIARPMSPARCARNRPCGRPARVSRRAPGARPCLTRGVRPAACSACAPGARHRDRQGRSRDGRGRNRSPG